MDHDRDDGHATDSASRDGPAGAPADQVAMRCSGPVLAPRNVSANSPSSQSAVTVAAGATVTSPVNESQARGLVNETGRCGRGGCRETEAGPYGHA